MVSAIFIELCPDTRDEKSVDDDCVMMTGLRKTEMMPTAMVAIVPPKTMDLRRLTLGYIFSMPMRVIIEFIDE